LSENPKNHPVLIVAADTIIGLTVLRSLGRRGTPVYCAWSIPDALGPQSSYCRGSFRLPDGRENALAAIQEYASRWGVTHILGVSENHIRLLNGSRDALSKSYTLLFPPQEVFEKAIKKNLTLECARRVGIPIPETLCPQNLQEAQACRRMRFPAILKLAEHRPAEAAERTFDHKYLRVESFSDLCSVLEKLTPGRFPMVQEYIPGSGVGVSMLVRKGKTVLAFQHRRIREFPPEGGIGVVCEAMQPEPKLIEQSEALLQEMGWEGVAMVEYRRDDRTGRYALMEVNGRFWGSLPTAIHAGADFPYWLYRTSFPGAPNPPREYRAGLRARSLAGDTKWLIEVLRGHKRPAAAAIAEYSAAFRPSTRYFMWSWDDPKPALGNFARRFWKTRPDGLKSAKVGQA
jgi:predicted ATP-grasp superfamily ATP-dependent carboligase